jgi:hypothetical protein
MQGILITQYVLRRVCTVQYSTVQYSTVQYSTVQYSTVQYSKVSGLEVAKTACCEEQAVICSAGRQGNIIWLQQL